MQLSRTTIISKAAQLGLTRPRHVRVWGRKDDAILRSLYNSNTFVATAKRLECSIDQVRRRACQLGIYRPRSRRWTAEEDMFLRKSFSSLTRREIAATLHRAPIVITLRLRKLGLPIRPFHRWKQNERDFVLKHYATMSNREIARQVGRSQSSVASVARSHGLAGTKEPRSKPWTSEEKKFLVRNYATMSNGDLALRLRRKISEVDKAASQLGLAWTKTGPRSIWKPEEREFLAKNYATLPISDIVRRLGRSAHAVHGFAYKHGLRKTSR